MGFKAWRYMCIVHCAERMWFMKVKYHDIPYHDESSWLLKLCCSNDSNSNIHAEEIEIVRKNFCKESMVGWLHENILIIFTHIFAWHICQDF